MTAKFDNISQELTTCYQSDIDAIIAKRYDNDGDYWATPDNRICKGGPFSTTESLLMLSDLEPTVTPIMLGACELILSLWRDDGRFQIAPKATIFPCHTANVARVLCRLGYAQDKRLLKTFDHLREIQHEDGGWRCNTYKFGRGPETSYSNPGTTLAVLDAFRFTPNLNTSGFLDAAVESLLCHWEIKKPIGPCQYGIGKLFMMVEYPFSRYNLFYFVYVLSFYEKAKKDKRFLNALKVLTDKTLKGNVVVENPNRKLSNFTFCKKGAPSEIATQKYNQILYNLKSS
jgi:hypothetical protein